MAEGGAESDSELEQAESCAEDEDDEEVLAACVL